MPWQSAALPAAAASRRAPPPHASAASRRSARGGERGRHVVREARGDGSKQAVTCTLTHPPLPACGARGKCQAAQAPHLDRRRLAGLQRLGEVLQVSGAALLKLCLQLRGRPAVGADLRHDRGVLGRGSGCGGLGGLGGAGAQGLRAGARAGGRDRRGGSGFAQGAVGTQVRLILLPRPSYIPRVDWGRQSGFQPHQRARSQAAEEQACTLAN